jgi:hypothetical protein
VIAERPQLLIGTLAKAPIDQLFAGVVTLTYSEAGDAILFPFCDPSARHVTRPLIESTE